MPHATDNDFFNFVQQLASLLDNLDRDRHWQANKNTLSSSDGITLTLSPLDGKIRAGACKFSIARGAEAIAQDIYSSVLMDLIEIEFHRQQQAQIQRKCGERVKAIASELNTLIGGEPTGKPDEIYCRARVGDRSVHIEGRVQPDNTVTMTFVGLPAEMAKAALEAIAKA